MEFLPGKTRSHHRGVPCELDTASVALTISGRWEEVISFVMDGLLNDVGKDSIVQVSRHCHPI